MKISKPISFEPPSHKDNGEYILPWFNEDMRHEIRSMARQGQPVSMKRGKLYYRNETEGVEFCVNVEALAKGNQGRSNWMRDAFECQIWVERVLKAISAHDVIEIEQLHRGLLAWRWKEREFGAYSHRDAFVCLRIAEGENYREDLFDLNEPLTPDFMLGAMKRIEKALSEQIKLKIYLDKKDVKSDPVPSGLVVGAIRIHVGLDCTFSDSCSLDTAHPDEETIKKIRGYVQEYEASRNTALREKNPIEAMVTDFELA